MWQYFKFQVSQIKYQEYQFNSETGVVCKISDIKNTTISSSESGHESDENDDWIVISIPEILYILKLMNKFLSRRVLENLKIELDFMDITSSSMRNYFYLFDNDELYSNFGPELELLKTNVASISLENADFDNFFCSSNSHSVVDRLLWLHTSTEKLNLSNCTFLCQKEIRQIRKHVNIRSLIASGNYHIDILIDDLSSPLPSESLALARPQQPSPAPVTLAEPVIEDLPVIFTNSSIYNISPPYKFSLTSLNLLECQNLTSQAIGLICLSFPELTALYLDGANLFSYNGKQIANLKHLTTLQLIYINDELDSNVFLNYFLMPEAGLSKFVNLKLTQKTFTDTPEGYDIFYQFLSQKLSKFCKILDLTECGIDDNLLNLIFKICGKHLEILMLPWNESISDLPFLNLVKSCQDTTSLTKKTFTDSWPENWISLKLQRLILSGNNHIQVNIGENLWLDEISIKFIFRKLKFLALQYCNSVNDDFLRQIKTIRPDLEIIDYYRMVLGLVMPSIFAVLHFSLSDILRCFKY